MCTGTAAGAVSLRKPHHIADLGSEVLDDHPKCSTSTGSYYTWFFSYVIFENVKSLFCKNSTV